VCRSAFICKGALQYLAIGPSQFAGHRDLRLYGFRAHTGASSFAFSRMAGFTTITATLTPIIAFIISYMHCEDNKIEGAEVSSFGYMSLHFVVKMKDSYKGPRYMGLSAIPLEIQIRTIAMDAWATISHYLDYKREIDIPGEMKRDFHALSGLFYVADSHFEMFFRQREIGRTEIAAEIKSGNAGLDQVINLDTLSAYLLSKFPDRKQPVEPVSELVSELHSTGYTTLIKLDAAIHAGYDAFLAYEKASPPVTTDADRRYAHVGVVRMLLCIYDENFRKMRQFAQPQQFVPYERLLLHGPKRKTPDK
jgi:Region found in RelA / SpoT proteins